MKIPVMCCTAIDENPKDILDEFEWGRVIDEYKVSIEITRRGGYVEIMLFDQEKMEWF